MWGAARFERRKGFSLSWTLCMAWSVQPKGQRPNCDLPHRGLSLLGALMSALYSTVAFGASLASAGTHNAEYRLRDESTADLVFGVRRCPRPPACFGNPAEIP
jgi:hypothetical protein